MLIDKQQKKVITILTCFFLAIVLYLAINLIDFNQLEKLSLPKLSFSKLLKQNSNQEKIITNKEEVLITRIIDGDTIVDSQDRKIRLIGINTPELDKNNKLFCFANKSSSRVSDLILNKKVYLEKDISDVDKYQRLLRYVWLEDKMINQILLEEGLAQVSTYAPDIKYQETFLEIQQKSRENNLGLWGGVCD